MAISKTANVNGIIMNYAYFGSGDRILVMIPGISVKNVSPSAEYIEQMYKDFLDTFTVYVFDRRDNVPDNYSIQNIANDTVEVIKSLGISRFDLYGPSQGGMVSMYIAALYPEMVNSLVLASTSYRLNDTFIKKFNNWYSLAKNKSRKELAIAFADDISSPSTVLQTEKIYAGVSSAFTDEELEKFSKLCLAFDTCDLEHKLKSIKCRSLVLAAKGDQLFPYEDMLKISEELGGEIITFSEDFGHAVYDESPDFIKRIYEFLS